MGFHRAGFQVNVCICDGAASNVAAIGLFTGIGIGENPLPNDPDFDHYLMPSVSVHPVTGGALYWMIDPVHMLKSARNWVLNSYYVVPDAKPGAKPAKHTYRRLWHANGFIVKEMFRALLVVDNPADSLGTLSCLGLHDVDMPGFARMHVSPALRFLSTRVACALAVWNHPLTRPAHSQAHKYEGHLDAAAEYVEVFANLFREFFLKGDLKLWDMADVAWKHLNKAEEYVRNWSRWIQWKARQVYPAAHQASDRRTFQAEHFLAWISVRNLMLMLQGYRGYCRDWFQRHPGKYKSPMLTSQSHLESFFGQVRRHSGDAENPLASQYATVVHQFSTFKGSGTNHLQRHLQPAPGDPP